MKWAAKILAKLVISRLPVAYKLWKSLGVFRHGRMDSAEYPLKIFMLHTGRAYPQGLPPKLVLLELGPGDSIASAVIGSAFGASKTYLVDVGDFAVKDTGFYRELARQLSDKGLSPPDLSAADSFNEILKVSGGEYLTNGIVSLRTIPTASVDLVWSHSVIEHVRKHDLPMLLEELKRIMKPGALASHCIDFQDHLDGALNNLRFSERLWESSFFASSGFYTNRIPAKVMHRMFEDSGFKIREEAFGQWEELPTSRDVLHKDFQKYQDEDLINRTSYVLLSD